LIDFQSGGLGDLGSELGTEFCNVVGKEGGLVAGAGDRDVTEAGVEQVRVDAGISVNEHAFRGEALRAVTCDGIAVVKMTMLARVELDLAVVVGADGKAAVGMDCLYDGEVAVGDAERFVGYGNASALAKRKANRPIVQRLLRRSATQQVAIQ